MLPDSHRLHGRMKSWNRIMQDGSRCCRHVIAITLALLTKEVISSLLIGILTGNIHLFGWDE